MSTKISVDAARVELMLAELRLPGIKLMWAKLAEQSDKEGWPAARFLAALAEHEMADRGRRRIARHLAEARLPVGKTLEAFDDFDAVPMISKAQVMALTAGDSWLGKGANILLFGPPGAGKGNLAAAIGLALVENGWRVLFTRTTDLVQRLQVARRELALESALAKRDKYHLLIADRLAIRIRSLEVMVEADLDVRGTLLVDRSVPVGFQRMRCQVHLQLADDADPARAQMLLAAAEHSCVVLQTLRKGVSIDARVTGPLSHAAE
jgi:DNA replication protein DnaC